MTTWTRTTRLEKKWARETSCQKFSPLSAACRRPATPSPSGKPCGSPTADWLDCKRQKNLRARIRCQHPRFKKRNVGHPITWATRPPLLLVPRDRGRTSPLPRGAAVAALAVPLFRYPQKQFVGNRMVVTTYNDHVRLLSPGPWLVGTTKVYPGVGADIVMESITPTTGLGVGCYRQIKLTAVRETFSSEHFDAPFRILAAQSFTSIRFWRVLETLISFMRASSNRESLECKAPLQVSGKDLFSAPVGRLR